MAIELLQFGLIAFVTLLVVVDPFGVAPVFVAIAKDLEATERRQTVLRAVAIAFGVTLFFLLAGRALLSYLGVTVHAFAISGGILLFATALPMLFGVRPALQSPDRDERRTAGEDIAIFPLAIPLLSGPGAIATILAYGSSRRRSTALRDPRCGHRWSLSSRVLCAEYWGMADASFGRGQGTYY
ncbi:MAG: MarC family protein [Gammaproteobacteria bacterium]